MMLRKVAIGIGVAITVAVVVFFLLQHGLITKIPWIEKKHVVWRNVEFTTTELKFGVNYTMICTIHKGPNYYCMDIALDNNGARPGMAYKIIAYVRAPAEIVISGRCFAVDLNHTGYYTVIARFYKKYDLYIVTYRNSTGIYHYTYRYVCGKPICHGRYCIIVKPSSLFRVIFDIPAYRVDLKHNKLMKINYTRAYGWFVVYKIR